MSFAKSLIDTIISGDHDMEALKKLYEMVKDHESGNSQLSEQEYEKAKEALSFLNFNG